jgi:hypothetical protein
VRIGPNDVIISDTEALRKILGARSRYVRSDFYTAIRFDPSRDNLLTQRNDKLHGALRAKMAAGVSLVETYRSLRESLTVDDSIQAKKMRILRQALMRRSKD